MKAFLAELSEVQVREALRGEVLKQGDFMARLAAKLNRNPKSMFHPSHLGRNKKVLDKMLRGKKIYKRQVGSKIVWALTLMAIDRFEADHHASKAVGKKSEERAPASGRAISKAPVQKSGGQPSEERISSLEARIRSLEAWKRFVTTTFLERRKAIKRMLDEGVATVKQEVS